ncbi:hypothetical protein LCGC14_1232550 [marine sediment metagenome]|uniref:HTH cro/C1-type domain-containing protein n=1 Tax=marine sediment metagenome TaxID=412755 RepID=A0A0F9LC69_9ZZZZ
MDLGSYLEDNGITIKWFSEQLGVSHFQVSNFCRGRVSLNTRFWRQVVHISKGAVTYDDLINMNFISYKRNKDERERAFRLQSKRFEELSIQQGKE